MDINIRLLGSELSVEVASDGSVGMLRGVVADEAGVDVRHMRLRADGTLLADDEARLCDVLLDAGSVVEGDCWKEDSVLARDVLLHEHGIDVAAPLPAFTYPPNPFDYYLERILDNDNPDQLDLLLRSNLDVGEGVTLRMAVQFGAHRCVDVMLDRFEFSPREITDALSTYSDTTGGQVLCVLRLLRHCREQGVVVDQTDCVQTTFKDLISRSPAHPELCQLLMRLGAVITLDVICGAHANYKTLLQSCDVSPDIFLRRGRYMGVDWATFRNLDFVRSLHASWYERAHPDGDKDVHWFRMMSYAPATGGCSDERIVERIFNLGVQLHARRQRMFVTRHKVQRDSVIGASRVNSVFHRNSEGPLCEEPCDPGCRCITCLDEERYTGRRFCLGGGGGGGWRKVPAVVRAQRKARIAQQMSRAAQRCRRQR